MATHNFKTFDSTNANMTDDATYTSDTTRVNGAQMNSVADPLSYNKAVHQSTIMATALAKFMVNQGISVDDTNEDNLTAALEHCIAPGDELSFADRMANAFLNNADVGSLKFCGAQSTPAAATYAVTGTGNLLGGYHYREVLVTGYKNPVGTYYVRGFVPATQRSAYDVSPSSQQVFITNIPVGGAGCIGRAIYRSAANGAAGTEKFCAVIWDNTTTSYTDNKVDSQLGTGMPDVEGTAIPADVPTANTTGTTLDSQTLKCTTTGTVHALTGAVSSGIMEGVFKADADYNYGDTFTVNGTAKTAVLPDGEELPSDFFHNNYYVPFIYDGTTLNFKSAGGTNLNVFVQPAEPTNKNGLWLENPTKEAIKKVVFDTNVWASGQWQNPSLVANFPSNYPSRVLNVNGKFYVIGYTIETIYVYDPLTNTYTNLQGYSDNELGSSIACCVYEQSIYIFGGMQYVGGSAYTTLAVKYDTSTNVWSPLHPLPIALSYACCAVYNGDIYILGGEISGGLSHYTLKYNISSNSYIYMINSPTAFYEATCSLYGSGIYIWSLQYRGKYSPVSNTYVTIDSGIYSEFHNSKSITIGDKIYIFGGYNGSNYINTVGIYDPINPGYTYTTMPEAKGVAGIGMADNSLYVFYGDSVVEHYMFNAKQYDYSPTFIIYHLPSDITHEVSIVKSSKIDYLPTYFKDCMLFKDGNITFPALYVGDGTSWTKIREAQ